MRNSAESGAYVTLFVLFVAVAAGWLTHVIHCLQHAEWGFLIAGAIMFPIGVIHGIGLWFGLF